MGNSVNISLCEKIEDWNDIRISKWWQNFSHDNSRSVDMLIYWFSYAATASTGLVIANTHMPHKQVRHTAAVQNSIHELRLADLYNWGRWRVSENELYFL